MPTVTTPVIPVSETVAAMPSQAQAISQMAPAAVQAMPQTLPAQAMAPAAPTPAPIQAMTQIPAQAPAAPAPAPVVPSGNADDLFAAMSQDAGQGLEQIDSQSLSIPYIYIAQAMSPVVQDGKAQMGQFVNSVTNEAFDKLTFIPCHFMRRYQAYNKQSGDYVGSFTPTEIEGHQLPGVYSEFGHYCLRQQTPDGHFVDCELNDTRLHYIMYQTAAGTWSPAIISLSRTQTKASRRLLSMAKTFELKTPTGRTIHNPPIFSCIYEATRTTERNDKGQWFSWMFERIGPVGDQELYFRCRDLYTAVKNEPVSDDSPNNKETSAIHAQQHSNVWTNPAQAITPNQTMAPAAYPNNNYGYQQMPPQMQQQAAYGQDDVPF